MAEGRSRRYPIGIQTFQKLREEGYQYVDKTEYVYLLAHEDGNSFFLSRPRRFGKSLLLSTMQAYFQGRRELFEGLMLGSLETEWESYPVLRLDLSTVKTRDMGELQLMLDAVLRPYELAFGRDEADQTPGSRLKSLIERAHTQTGKKVVVLVDEYDAPLLNVIDSPDLLADFRMAMREFYIPLKAADEHLRFVFLTGITKFSQLSIFSELNNLRNISMDPTFAGICGITEEELTTQMGPDIALLAQKLGVSEGEALGRLKEQYDGYHFCVPSPDIYNPFSLLNAFAEGRVRSFWFGSGTPTALIDIIVSNGWEISDLTACEADESEFDAPTEQMATPVAMLYQAGYLTIEDYDEDLGVYTLGIPNREVSRGLSQGLVRHAAPNAFREHNLFLVAFARSLRAGDVEDALGKMRAYLAGIPYHLGSHDERGFETTLYLVFDLLGAKIQTEFKTATGRVDSVMWTRDSIFVMEFKYDRSAVEALAQIDERGYLVPFQADGRALVKAGVNFSSKTCTIEDWVIEQG